MRWRERGGGRDEGEGVERRREKGKKSGRWKMEKEWGGEEKGEK